MKRALTGLTLEELGALIKGAGHPAFRAGQIHDWLQKGAGFEGMKNLPQALLGELAAEYAAQGVRIEKTLRSKLDGTEKYLFALEDGNIVEGVFMRYAHGNTLCVSTQVGCRMGCAFCASGLEGLVRNMEPGEMLSQVLLAGALHREGQGRGVTNVVLMGSGEPLDNYENVLRFLRLLSAPRGMNISLRNVTLSTCGLVPEIDRLAGEDLPLTLSISLHAADDGRRREIMPVAKLYSIGALIESCKAYVKKTGRRVSFEYALIQGVNSTLEEADALAELLRGFQCHVNLIPVNFVPEKGLTAPGLGGIERFQARLQEKGVAVSRRREMGADIGGACGQLRRRHIENSAN
ncbi:MAG: 23S rRNA (adenine(2503)-C(2))-methyltransferase RlmN [Christensenellaceae bacterium]|nr:23S rRNA (adenine(2503)-C(2))-methyltransferase RlmN [Christensenellaceae bacterium]